MAAYSVLAVPIPLLVPIPSLFWATDESLQLLVPSGLASPLSSETQGSLALRSGSSSHSPSSVPHQGPFMEHSGYQDWPFSCGQDRGPWLCTYWPPVPYSYAQWSRWYAPWSWWSHSSARSNVRSLGRSVAGSIDPLQVQALVSLPPVRPTESSLPLVQEQDLVLAQLTASSSSLADLAVPDSSSPSLPEDFKALCGMWVLPWTFRWSSCMRTSISCWISCSHLLLEEWPFLLIMHSYSLQRFFGTHWCRYCKVYRETLLCSSAGI